jgi:signal transduction histidine kinase
VVAGLALYIAAVYAIVVLGADQLIGTGNSPKLWLSALATAIVALSFEAVQARLERAVAAVLGVRASPYEVLSRFADTTHAASSDDLPARMAELLAEGTGAATAQVWLMVGNVPTLAASWPASTTGETAPPVLSGATHHASVDGRRSLPVRDGGELLGVLSVRENDDAPLTPVEERLFAGLAAQAGLVLRAARLRAELSLRLVELSARADELRASRERLIETQDGERKSLERDIHDGAQQNLVALTVNLRLAQTVAGRAPDRARTVLAAQSLAAQDAIDTLSQLSRGIYPAVLADQGLIPALRSVVATSPLEVVLQADRSVRLPQECEAALYFCCLEALQNAAKHSATERASVCLVRGPGTVRLTVSDSGRGFDRNRAPEGAGLANMRDRIDALGGSINLTSVAGAGTTVEIELPLAAIGAAS